MSPLAPSPKPSLRCLLLLGAFAAACTANSPLPGSDTPSPYNGDEQAPVGQGPAAATPDSVDGVTGTPPASTKPRELPKLTPEQTRLYLAQLAPMLVGRELNAEELETIDNAREQAISPIVQAWTQEPGFAAAARLLIEQKLYVSGSKDGIDYDLPGNLAEYIVKNGLPFSTLLTADYCVNAQGEKAECDTGAPFKAGVLGTRAYLSSRKSRFNLTRASTFMNAFACRVYPLEDSLQPRIDKTRLISMFQAQSPDEQTDPNAQNGFGNGFACYTCHGQFSLHAQVFVRFDQSGLYKADATGLQDPAGELGKSTNGLYASHLKDPAEAASERSQVFGKEVANLREAALAVAESPAFVSCQIRNVLEFTLGLNAADPIQASVLADISRKAREGGDPTFGALVAATFNHPGVVEAVVPGIGGAP